MRPWEEGRECVGACVAWCDFADVYAACMCARVYFDMGIPMRILSYTYLSKTNKEEEAFENFVFRSVMILQCS